MNTCIFHVGCPKTGTTSIQQTLGWKLKDPAFRLVSRDAAWGNLALCVLFKTNPMEMPLLREKSISSQTVQRLKNHSLRILNASLQRARQSQITPIISGEAAYRFSESEMEHVKAFLAERGFACRVSVCVRPTQDISESGFQQFIKTFHAAPDKIELIIRSRTMDYEERLRVMDKVFGRENVDVFAFNPAWFPDGCAVQNFCKRYGIACDKRDVIRTNESVNLNAIKLLFAWSLYGERTKNTRYDLFRTRLIVRRLQSLEGPRLTFHRDLMTAKLEQHAREQPALEQRLGHAFPASWRTRGPDEGIRSLNDLMDYPPELLDWLARQTGQKAITHGSGPSTAMQVAQQLKSLRLLSDPKVLAGSLRSWMEFNVNRMRSAWRS